MTKLELIQKIGSEICEDCGPHRDCDTEYDECPRIANAITWLDNFMHERDKK